MKPLFWSVGRKSPAARIMGSSGLSSCLPGRKIPVVRENLWNCRLGQPFLGFGLLKGWLGLVLRRKGSLGTSRALGRLLSGDRGLMACHLASMRLGSETVAGIHPLVLLETLGSEARRLAVLGL